MVDFCRTGKTNCIYLQAINFVSFHSKRSFLLGRENFNECLECEVTISAYVSNLFAFWKLCMNVSSFATTFMAPCKKKVYETVTNKVNIHSLKCSLRNLDLLSLGCSAFSARCLKAIKM